MLFNNKQVAVGLVIDKHLENGIKLLEQIKNIPYIDIIIVATKYDYFKDDHLKIKVLKFEQSSNKIAIKNKILKYCYQREIQNIFLLSDDVIINDVKIFQEYISISNKYSLNFLSVNNNEVYTIDKQITLHKTVNDNFVFIKREAVKFVGYFDQNLNQNNYLEDYYVRLISKEAAQPSMSSFPDILNSSNYIQILENNNHQCDWSFLERKYGVNNLNNFLEFKEQNVKLYYKYKTVATKIKNKKEYRTAACLIAKNQNEYLDEWIQYYYQLGFDMILIYENNCEIKLKYQYPYVEIIPWNMQKTQQQQNAYINCMRQLGPYVDFIAFFDADEFLYIKNDVSLQDFLRQYYDCFGIAINWRFFGNNGLEKVENDNYEVLTRFTKCDKNIAEQVKLILNCQLIKELSDFKQIVFHSSHYINYPVSLTDKSYQIGPLNPNIQNSDLYAAEVYHYSVKTMQEFVKFKQYRGRADIVVEDDTYQIPEYWGKQNKNDVQNFNIANALNRNVNSHYAEFNLIDGTQEYIKFEHIDRFKFENLILNMFKIKRVEQCSKEPLVTVSSLPPKDKNNWQGKLLSSDRPYIIYTKMENNKVYFHIQIVKQKDADVYRFNCIFAFIWKMFFTSLMFINDSLVLHGMLLKNGNIIVGTSGCGKTTFAQRLAIEDGDRVICDDNVLITWKDDKLIAQPLPMLPYVKEGRQFKWTNIDFSQQIEVKDIFILTKDIEEKVVQIDKEQWKQLMFYSGLVLIYQPFAQRNEVYNTIFDKWIDCRDGLRQFCQKRILQLVNKLDKKPLLMTTNTGDITKNINKQLKDSLSLN